MIEDELAIGRVLATYCQRVDDGDFAGAAQLFTADGSFDFGGDVSTGQEALVDWLERMQPPHRRGKHISVSPVVDVDGDRAAARSDFLFVRWIKGALTVEMAGVYRDRFVRDARGWLIERRDVEVLTPPSGAEGMPRR